MEEVVEPVVGPAGEWGTIMSADQSGYLGVIAGAIRIHIDRERVRRGLWKEADAKDQFNMIKIKSDRIMRTLEILRDDPEHPDRAELERSVIEEGYDIINYTVFGIRQLGGTV